MPQQDYDRKHSPHLVIALFSAQQFFLDGWMKYILRQNREGWVGAGE